MNGDLEVFARGIVVALLIFSIGVMLWPKRKRRNRRVPMGRRGPHVRVPRVTSWERANRVYGDTQ
jgi:hypothetical protein